MQQYFRTGVRFSSSPPILIIEAKMKKLPVIKKARIAYVVVMAFLCCQISLWEYKTVCWLFHCSMLYSTQEQKFTFAIYPY